MASTAAAPRDVAISFKADMCVLGIPLISFSPTKVLELSSTGSTSGPTLKPLVYIPEFESLFSLDDCTKNNVGLAGSFWVVTGAWVGNACDTSFEDCSISVGDLGISGIDTGACDGASDSISVGVCDGAFDGACDGASDGVFDGAFDGTTDGISDGASDGGSDSISDGARDGISDGVCDGASDGVFDGTPDGISDGVCDGILDGVCDGPLDGASDGTSDGSSDGVAIGTSVGVLPNDGLASVASG